MCPMSSASHWLEQGQDTAAVRVWLQTPAPAEAGVSIATSVTKPKGGPFVLHAEALHDDP